jgi:glucose/arabinose dehydrogenase
MTLPARVLLPFSVVLLLALSAHGVTLPGFRSERVGSLAAGEFVSSLAIDSKGVIYYTTTKGNLYRFGVDQSTLVATVPTAQLGDSGLIGMALRDDATAVVHYTRPNQTYDVLSSIDLTTGFETVLAELAADKDLPERGSSAEHHGGNPMVAPDGSVYFGIGDYGGGLVAAQPDWNGGKIWQIRPDGTLHQFARGFRNPFDIAYDAAHDRLVVPDNGQDVDDEINLVSDGDNCGWPFTSGNREPIEGGRPPAYVFPTVVAPTGIVALNGKEPLLAHGYLLGAFVTKGIYYIAGVDAQPIAPIAILKGDAMVIDVAQASTGEIYYVTAGAAGSVLWRLFVPQRGDCNGDGRIDAADLTTLAAELRDGPIPEAATEAPNGAVAASWGCDANGDGVIDTRDVPALSRLIGGRVRAVRH